MKRHAPLILKAIGAGLITMVIVTWALALHARHQTHESTTGASSIHAWSSKGDVAWSLTRNDNASSITIVSMRARGLSTEEAIGTAEALIPPWCPFDQPMEEFASGRSNGEIRIARAYGWPIEAGWYEKRITAARARAASYHGAVRLGVAITAEGRNDGCELLPRRPIWRGVIWNSLFYAAAWFVLVAGLAHAQRARRIHRGQCPQCGYDLRGGRAGLPSRLADAGSPASTPGCPECGWNRERADSTEESDQPISGE